MRESRAVNTALPGAGESGHSCPSVRWATRRAIPGPPSTKRTGCGAAVCRDHVIVAAVHLTRLAPINRQVRVEPPARQLRCTTCNAAHLAATNGHQQGVQE